MSNNDDQAQLILSLLLVLSVVLLTWDYYACRLSRLVRVIVWPRLYLAWRPAWLKPSSEQTRSWWSICCVFLLSLFLSDTHNWAPYRNPVLLLKSSATYKRIEVRGDIYGLRWKYRRSNVAQLMSRLCPGLNDSLRRLPGSQCDKTPAQIQEVRSMWNNSRRSLYEQWRSTMWDKESNGNNSNHHSANELGTDYIILVVGLAQNVALARTVAMSRSHTIFFGITQRHTTSPQEESARLGWIFAFRLGCYCSFIWCKARSRLSFYFSLTLSSSRISQRDWRSHWYVPIQQASRLSHC